MTRNGLLKTRNCLFKNEELSIKNEEFDIKNDDFYITNDDFCRFSTRTTREPRILELYTNTTEFY